MGLGNDPTKGVNAEAGGEDEKPAWQRAIIAGTRGASTAVNGSTPNLGAVTMNAVNGIRKLRMRKPNYPIFDSPLPTDGGYGGDNA